METVATLLALLPFYLLGAFPTGFLIARAQGITLWNHGSGNVGATNVTRILGARAGLLTLLGDVAKGLIAVGIAVLTSSSVSFSALSAIAVVAGHCFSIPGKLRGGKGVATALGAMLALSPLCALLSVGVFGGVVSLSKMVSLASLSAALSAPLFAMLLQLPNPYVAALAVVALLITVRHRANIERIAQGKENKIGKERAD